MPSVEELGAKTIHPRIIKVPLMSQQRLTGSLENTDQQIARRESRPDFARSFQGGLHPILQLHRTSGNRRVAQLIQAKRLTPEGKIIGVQRKLTVGAPEDQYEQEPDRVARQVLSMPDSVTTKSLQRDISPEAEDNKDLTLEAKPLAASPTSIVQPETESVEESENRETPIQAKSTRTLSGSFEAEDSVETQINQSKGSGSPLPDPVRAYMEPRFGIDFSHMRVHTGRDAVRMNQAVGALAFTHGSDIYFGAGRGPTNAELTAHELTHVAQQTPPLLQGKNLEDSTAPGYKSSSQPCHTTSAVWGKKEKEFGPISDAAPPLGQESLPQPQRQFGKAYVQRMLDRRDLRGATDTIPATPRLQSGPRISRHGGPLTITSLAVANATATASDPNSFVTTTTAAAGNVVIDATLNPAHGPGDLADHSVRWRGGRAGPMRSNGRPRSWRTPRSPRTLHT